MSRSTINNILSKMEREIASQKVNVQLLKINKELFKHRATTMNNTVETAIKCIRKKVHNQQQANLLVSGIENLENLLSQENDLTLLIKKTEALTKMLDLVVINRGTPEENIRAMENFLASMCEISEEKKQKVALYSLIAAMVLIIVIMAILSNLVFPLIPVAAGLTAFGLTAAALTATSLICNGLIYMLSMFIVSVPISIIQKELTGPVGRFIQMCTDEYKAADRLGDNLLGFFSLKRIEDECQEQPLLDDAEEMEQDNYRMDEGLQVN